MTLYTQEHIKLLQEVIAYQYADGSDQFTVRKSLPCLQGLYQTEPRVVARLTGFNSYAEIYKFLVRNADLDAVYPS